MFVKPTRPNLVIRDPKTDRLLPEQGMRVQPSQFWFRRIRDGDVESVDVTATPKAKPPKKAK